MDPSLIFRLANGYALLCWLVLLIRPSAARLVWLQRLGVLALALLYTAVMLGSWGQAEGDFSTLAGVMRLFTYEWAALGGWIHYLAFDLFVGISLQKRFIAAGTTQWLRVPILFATFMFGPFGFLLFSLWHFFTSRGDGPLSARESSGPARGGQSKKIQ